MAAVTGLFWRGTNPQTFDLLLILFRIYLWSSAGKEPSPWLSTCVVFILVPSCCICPFPFGVWGRVSNLIVSVPDHCLFNLLSCQPVIEILRNKLWWWLSIPPGFCFFTIVYVQTWCHFCTGMFPWCGCNPFYLERSCFCLAQAEWAHLA